MLLWNQAFPSLNHISRTKHVITAGSVSILAQQRHLRETDSIKRAASRKLFEDALSVYKFVKDNLRPPRLLNDFESKHTDLMTFRVDPFV